MAVGNSAGWENFRGRCNGALSDRAKFAVIVKAVRRDEEIV